MKLIGVMGGMFDPVHLGHLRAAVELRESMGLDCVHLVPCAHPPHRASALMAAEKRLQLLHQCVRAEPGLVVDDCEIHAPGPSYTVNTLSLLRERMPDAGLCLAVGMDAFLSMHTWHQWQRLFDLSHLVVMHRPGWQLAQVMERLDAALHDRVTAGLCDSPARLRASQCGRVCFLPVTGMDISSSLVRELVRAGRSVRYLVPDAIVEEVTNLYASRD